MLGLSYWFIPLFSGCVWFGTLLAMLVVWLAQGSQHLASMDATQHIAYISDVGATSWGKPLFIAGSATMVVTFDLAFISERWLRHKGRLTQNYTNTEKILSLCAIFFSIVGAAGLILLTIFDTLRHPHIHVAMLAVFIAGYVVAAIFVCAEYQRLGIYYREYRILRASFWIKLAFIFVEIALAIAFGVLGRQKHYNRAAIVEWIIALIYIIFVWSFIIDFLPATQTRHQGDRFAPPIRKQDDEMAVSTEAGGSLTGGPVYSSGGHYANSHRQNGNSLNTSSNF